MGNKLSSVSGYKLLFATKQVRDQQVLFGFN